MPQPLQPFLHDLVTVLAAPTLALSGRDGDIDGTAGAQAVLHADVRVLSVVELRVAGGQVEHIATRLDGQEAVFTSLVRRIEGVLDPTPNPTVRIDRVRSVAPGRVAERYLVSSRRSEDVAVPLSVRFAADFATLAEIRVGHLGTPHPLTATATGGAWSAGSVAATLSAPDAAIVTGVDDLTVEWLVRVPGRGSVEVGWSLAVRDEGGVVVSADEHPDHEDLVQRALALAGPAAADRRLEPWLRRSLADLAGLRMAAAARPDQPFYAAGSPWYFTLFGRDSLLSARMMLAVDPTVAAGTLRTLAALQGSSVDPVTAEEPGKIMHELRRSDTVLGAMQLPPLYYGTIDATPLWVALLHDAWQAGLDSATVRDLLPTLEGALGWLTAYGDADGDGFLEYLDSSGRGLVNQGWKDSADSVRFADGTIAVGPVALCEVQGYAYEAAVRGADLLDAFGLDGGDDCRVWADGLAERFRDRFWCEAGGRRFPALALDGAKRRVDSLTSNIGHLLGTGLLSAEEELLVADLVSGPELDSGLGLRTMSSADDGYAPLSYHCGSVWPHDTAVVIAGLVRAGLVEHAAGLVEGLLAASAAFDGRLPELYSGEGRPVPYPASCRPQAWSAAAVVPVTVALAQLSG